MSLNGVQSTYIIPPPGVHYVSPPGGRAASYPAYALSPQSSFYNVNYTMSPSSAYAGYSPYPAYSANASYNYGYRYPVPYIPAPHIPYPLPGSGKLEPQQAPSLVPAIPPPSPEAPRTQSEKLQEMANNEINTGKAAFKRGLSITLLPAFVIGIVTLVSNKANLGRGLLNAVVLGTITLAMGGVASIGWYLRERYKKMLGLKNLGLQTLGKPPKYI